MQCYTPGDRIYVFGFSRGAFAARSLAGFADAVGLLLKGRENKRNVDFAYSLYEHGEDPSQSRLREFLYEMTGSKAPGIEGPNVLPIYLIALWDTVGALGLPGRLARFSAPRTEFHQTELPRNVTHARHALALHELRGQFEPLLWFRRHAQNLGQSLEQVWFTGAHADVGGGYKPGETNWSDTALAWIANEASSLGLRLKPIALPEWNVRAPIHHQIRGVFSWSGPIKRKVFIERGKLAVETISTYSVHDSVLKRLQIAAARAYNFKAQVNTALKEIDEETLRMAFELNVDDAARADGCWKQITPDDLEGLNNWADQLIAEPANSIDDERLLCGVCTTAVFSSETFEQKVDQLISYTRLMSPEIKVDPLEARYDNWRSNLGRAVTALSDAKSRLSPKYGPLIDPLKQRLSATYDGFELELTVQRLRRLGRWPPLSPE